MKLTKPKRIQIIEYKPPVKVVTVPTTELENSIRKRLEVLHQQRDVVADDYVAY